MPLSWLQARRPRPLRAGWFDASGIACEGGLVVPVPLLTYDDALRERIGARLGSRRRRVCDLAGRKHAAVAVVLVDSQAGEARIDPVDGPPGPERLFDDRLDFVSGGAAFLLTRRVGRLRSHSFQYALPGGRVDAGETTIEAALRELDEELGTRLEEDAVLGLLDDYPTRSGYVMTPVVLWAGGPLEIRPAAQEVLAAYRVGLGQLLREDSPQFYSIPESERPVVQLPLGEQLLHAPTAAVLLQLRWWGLEGRHDRVDGLEQPVFAWR